MRIFVYEFVTDGDRSQFASGVVPGSLAQEGRAMRDAIAADLSRLDAVEVDSLDPELPEEAAFRAAAARADAVLIIAPEFDGILATRRRWADQAGAAVLGCSLAHIELFANKQRTAEFLASRDVPVPPGRLLAAGQPLPPDVAFPAVLKPVDGAGSLGIRLLSGPAGLAATPGHCDWRVEQFCPGLPASIALLCGPAGCVTLPACRQWLAGADRQDSPFAYLGGELPLPPPLDARARRLADAVVAALADDRSGLVGWLGIDVVLGDDPAGRDDVVIEINPRLTTSYLGLRRLACENLAAALLAVARGQPARLSFRSEPLQFAADGSLTALVGKVN